MSNLAYRSESGRESTSRLAQLSADVTFDAPARIARPRAKKHSWRVSDGAKHPVVVTRVAPQSSARCGCGFFAVGVLDGRPACGDCIVG